MEIQIKKKIFIIVGTVIALGLIATLTKGFGLIDSSITGSISKASDDSGETIIKLSDISENAKFYEYEYNGKIIKYFVVKADDGSIKTAFDACDVCYEAGKGYTQEGKYMVCNNCGNKYLITDLGTENKKGGGCWPGYLPSSVNDDRVIIKNSDLENEAWRF